MISSTSLRTSRIPESELERIKAAVSLADLCARYGIELKPHGKDLIGRCPFHDDRTPSFIVTPAKNLWNCLGACGCGGDNIQLVMKREKVSFRHAVEKLQTLAGVAPAPARVRTRLGTEHAALVDPATEMADHELMRHVCGFYHQTFCNDAKAMQYLQRRCCFHPEAVKLFQIGYANRTLGYRVPSGTAEGRKLKERLQRLGVLRASGHEHLNGSVVFPLLDGNGNVAQMYGRKVRDDLREGTPSHLYLEKPLGGVWNGQSLVHQKEILLCEAILDALTLWCAGFRNVTTIYGTNNFTDELWAWLAKIKPERIILCFDNDAAGNEAATRYAPRLAEMGMTVLRAKPPPDRDVNELACESGQPQAALALMLERSEILFKRSFPETPLIKKAALSSLAAEPEPEASKEKKSENESDLSDVVPPCETESDWETDTHTMRWGARDWRLRGVSKNLSYEILKVQLRVKVDESAGGLFFMDTLDLCNAKHRQNFVLQAQAETRIAVETLKRDLGQVLLSAEMLQERIIKQTLTPVEKKVLFTPEEREEAAALLHDPKLLERILEDYERCGIVGERTNKLVGYLAAISRKMDEPLAIIVQSTSAAGKSRLMDAILAFVPEEERIKYSAMTGQSLYYLGDADLKHKVLAIVEEEGAEKASYALKLLQSEGELTIASTGKDPNSGRMVTQEYHVEGPVMIFLTTTAIDIDEELLNRCIVLTVDESREQTRAIHELQREARTLEGVRRKQEKSDVLRVHRNAQRLLRPLRVVNPYARQLTFMNDRTRTRRDHEKYLTLIDAIAFLHQCQRPVKKDANRFDYIEVTLDDLAVANRLAGEALGRSLDELPPQTRRLLLLVEEMAAQNCRRLKIARADYRFSRRDVREFTGWSDTALKVHLHRLEEMEYLLVHRSRRGQGYVYEMLYAGEGGDGGRFVMGLIDVEKLRYDGGRSGQNGHWSAPGQAVVRGRSEGGQPPQNGKTSSLSPSESGDENGGKLHENGENAQEAEVFVNGRRSHSLSLKGAR